MKVLFVVDDYLPDSIKVASKMIHELALEFQRNGHDSFVLTPKSNINQINQYSIIDGVKVICFKSGRIKNTGKFERAINETLLSYQAWKASKDFFESNKFDLVVYYSPTIFFGSFIQFIKKKYKIYAYQILRDDFPQWTVDNGLIRKKSLIHLYFNFFEKINYISADKIGVMSDSNLKYFINKNRSNEKYEILYNWSETEQVDSPSDFYYRNRLGLIGKIVLFYGGNIGHAQHMQYLINLAIRFNENKNVHFVFVGKGDEVELILEQEKQYNLKNITYLEPVNQEDYFNMLNEFDIGLFSLHPNHTAHNFPGKLLGYMKYKKPILGCVNQGNDLKEIVLNANAGFIRYSGEEEQLFQDALKLVQSQELRDEIGKNAYSLLKNQFSVENAYNVILNSFNVELSFQN